METQDTAAETVRSGIPEFDELVQRLRSGDNVVWQVDQLEDYTYFARAFASQAIRDGYNCIYLNFTTHPPIFEPENGLTIFKIDPSHGFDNFAGQVHRIIEIKGKKTCYVFDNLSELVEEWATDELLANFFQVTCPYLFQIEAVAYFALRRGQHGHSTVARIRNTTQILLDVYHVEGNTYIQPLKVSGRYSPQMFIPHLLAVDRWESISRSGAAASVLAAAVTKPLDTSTQSIAPWDAVYRRLLQNRELDKELPETTDETIVLTEAMSRMMIGNHRKLVQLSKRYLPLSDLLKIRNRLVGSGRIGGKSAGMLLARNVLLSNKSKFDYSQVLEEHDSFYIGSDVFFTFLVNNDLFRLRLELTKTGKISREDFAVLEQRFLDGDFSSETMEQFRGMIDYYGQAPIIVRSSSLLEDGFTDAFAGKYRSEFCANQGSPENRLESFLRAIKLVYASALNPDALAYRHRRGLIEGDEQMAVLVQRVSGMPYRHYFFPSLAGVAFSRNLYAWTDRIDPRKGMIRLVFGLGTRAVNRVSGDYPRMIAVSHPQIRPEIGMEVAKYSQRMVDILDLEENTLATRPFIEIVKNFEYPFLRLITSEMADGYIQDRFSNTDNSHDRNLVLTFNNLINQTRLVAILGDILARLEDAWEQPVDIEFTAYVDSDNNVKVNLLQCRSLRVPTLTETGTTIPDNLPKTKILFRSSRAINAGAVRDIRHIIYIDPKKYTALPDAGKRNLGRVVGALNNHLRNKPGKVMMMGPGRWGSTNIALGVNVGYADIDSTVVLVEVAREEAGQTPEVSYGTHFFQDLVESGMLYLPVYPDDSSSDFNTIFFSQSPNMLAKLTPELADFEDIVLVIDVSLTSNGATAAVIADSHTRNAICFLDTGKA